MQNLTVVVNTNLNFLNAWSVFIGGKRTERYFLLEILCEIRWRTDDDFVTMKETKKVKLSKEEICSIIDAIKTVEGSFDLDKADKSVLEKMKQALENWDE